jgi:broad specificity phosphatase PhoE
MYGKLLYQKACRWHTFARARSAMRNCSLASPFTAGCAVVTAGTFAWNSGCVSAEETGQAIRYPVDLVIVRHGQSEANMMIEMKDKGDMSGQVAMDAAARHDSLMRLTDKGREQARMVGKWVNENIGVFDKFYVSEYVRTKETAANMGLKYALWQTDMMIRERDQGVQDGQGDVKMGLSEEEVHRMKKSPMYWQPLGGESMSDVCMRVRQFLNRLQVNASGMRTVVVCHYRTIHAFRFLLENTPQCEFSNMLSEKMPNCCIWWYSRRDEVGRVRSHYHTLKRIEVKPDGTADILVIPLKQKSYNNDQLLKEVDLVPQVLNNCGVVSP